METQYHIEVLTKTLGAEVSARALQAIIAGNLGQDKGWNQLKGYLHFDNSEFKVGLAYMEAQHALIAQSNDASEMWAAFGRLSHAAQDFYSHSNYVALWLETHGGLANTKPTDINGLDEKLLTDTRLVSGNFFIWRDIIYYLPLIQIFAKKYLVFPDSHEALHLDSPARGPLFPYSIIAAEQRTRFEYERVTRILPPAKLAIFRDIVI